jgi:hypothetical protein
VRRSTVTVIRAAQIPLPSEVHVYRTSSENVFGFSRQEVMGRPLAEKISAAIDVDNKYLDGGWITSSVEYGRPRRLVLNSAALTTPWAG